MFNCRITIPYTPKPKASVRTGKYGCYNPSSRGMLQTREYVRKCLADKQSFPLFTGPLLVICHFLIPAPLSLPTRKRAQQNFLPHIKRPDGDNLEKFLNDACNGLVWDDDAKIAWLLRSKSTTSDKTGHTTIFVKEIPMQIPDYHSLIANIMEHIEIK